MSMHTSSTIGTAKTTRARGARYLNAASRRLCRTLAVLGSVSLSVAVVGNSWGGESDTVADEYKFSEVDALNFRRKKTKMQ